MREDILRLALKYGRYGYRRITALLRAEGWHVNHKRVERIWREEGLKVPQKQKKRKRLYLNDGSCIRLRPHWKNHVWSYDFVADRLSNGKKITQLPQLPVHELDENKGQFQPLDVRKDKEWNNGYIPGATHVFLGELTDKLGTLEKEKNYAVYCASGYRASIASSLLQKNGFKNIHNIPGSFKAWKAAGLPIEKKEETQTMSEDIKQINDDISVAAFDPDKGSFKTFAEKGFKSLINLQTTDEDQNLDPNKEEELANDNNLKYRHIVVSKENLSEATVDNFRKELENLPKPVVVHCTSGKRSGAFVMMHIGCQQGMSGEEVIKKAEEMGFECDQAELEQFVKKYVNKNNAH